MISTRNRAALLEATLRSLFRDTSRVSRELVVVDNGSTDSTRDTVSRVATEHPSIRLRCIPQELPGKSRSLNLGVAATEAEFLIFTDDDVLVDDGWADALVAPFADMSVAVVGGRTLPLWPAGHAPIWLGDRVAEDLGLRDAGDVPRRLDPYGVVGVNMALRRAVLSGVEGPFETTLGPAANMKIDYEEYHLVSRLAEDHEIAYAPNAIVRHRIDAARLDWNWMRRMYFQRGLGSGRHDRLASTSLPRPVASAALFAHSYPRAQRLRVKHFLRGRSRPEQAEAEFFAFFAAGRHLEWLLGRHPRVCLRIASLLA